MRRLAWAWALVVGLLPLGCDRESAPARAPANPPALASADAGARPPPASRRLFFWRARLGQSTVHLLGSIHVAQADLYPLDATIEEAFDASDVLALELSLDDQTAIEAARRMMQAARLRPGQRLADVVPAQTWELFQRALSDKGGSGLGLRGFHPWFVSLALTMQAMEEAGFSGEHGIDQYFFQRAESSKRVVALESIDDQLSIFEGLSPEVEARMLQETLESLGEQPGELARAFALWRVGDAQALDELMLAPMRRDQPQLFDEIFARRNRRMVASLRRLAKQPARYFVVVGAGHLVGEDGIVELLRETGVRVRQMDATLEVEP